MSTMSRASVNADLREHILQLLPASAVSDLLFIADSDAPASAVSTEDLLRLLSIELDLGVGVPAMLLRRLLVSMPEEDLRNLTQDLLGRSHSMPLDNAIALSRSAGQTAHRALEAVVKALGLSDLSDVVVTATPISGDPCVASSEARALLPHQQIVIDKSVVTLKSHSRFVIQMPTGSGKTTTAISVLIRSGLMEQAGRTGGLVLWLAPTRELLEQAEWTFRALWASEGVGVSWIYTNDQIHSLDRIDAGGILFCTYQKLHALVQQSVDDEVLTSTPITAVIADEAHRSLARTFRAAIEACVAGDATILIGLTATPGREASVSRENSDLAAMYSSTIVRAYDGEDEIDRLQNEGILSTVDLILLGPRKSGKPECDPVEVRNSDARELDEIAPETIDLLAADRDRNRLLIATLRDAVDEGHRAIVFACSVQHARLLSLALRVTGRSTEVITADTRPSRRTQISEDFRAGSIAVLINYGVLTAGFDAPGTDFILISRPTSSIVAFSQMLGRALRGPKMGGVHHATVVYVDDQRTMTTEARSIYTHFDRYWSRSR